MFTTVFRTVILYLVVIIAIRLMGKRQIADMQPGELVVTLLISEIASMPLQDTTQPMLFGLSAIFTLVTLEIAVSLVALKSPLVRRLLSGGSVIIIEDGHLNQRALKKVRLTVPDLMELLRGQEVFDISTVAFAVLETGGSLSVMLKTCHQPVTTGQLNVKVDPATLPLTVISDGKVVRDALDSVNITPLGLQEILKGQNLRQEDVMLMTLDSRGNNIIIRKEKI
ncbi:MAG: DUF421 domain-containing protein [Clostridia bacterium]|nr:DUF421 domain-containing protein [Clostridia bacterium]